MKILKSWLKDYIDIDLKDEEIAKRLSSSGTSVEEIIYNLDEKVVVAKILKIEPHPNADRLRLATVTTGEKEQTVVCGAPNIEVGQTVPFAQLGSILPGNFEIKKAVIRGVESEGMLCAADELGLGTDHSGIIILPSDYKLGKPLREYISSDAVFDIEITPNRGDCLSHVGVARELAAILNQPLKEQKTTPIDKKTELNITVEANECCPQYHGCIIKGVKIADSPKWLQDRLKAVGSKPINNVVDITNYILMDLGQPLHAFDATKVDGGIIVRIANLGETITTLDGTSRVLPENTLVIADENKPVAIAGIMGGLNSEVTAETTDLILEGAEFERKSIRKSSKNLGLSTEASYRYERGIDSGNVRFALEKAANMIVELAGGQILGLNSVQTALEQVKIGIEYDRIRKILGIDIDNKKINEILENLGFAVENGQAVVPTWRHDVEIWQDLAEEVGRIYGYDKIKPIDMPISNAPTRSDYYKIEYIKHILAENGFSETLSYAFLSEADLKAAGIPATDLLEVANPLQPENKYLRNSIIPGLLKAVAKNPTFDPVLLFESGEVFAKESENTRLGVVASGKNAQKAIENIKNELIEKFNIDQSLLEIKELSREDLQRFKIKKPVVYTLEIDLSIILKNFPTTWNLELGTWNLKKAHYRPISKYPSITRDLAFIVDKDTDADQVADDVYEVSELISRVELFDEFASDKFGLNKKNIAYHIYLSHMDRTLRDEEADDVVKNIIGILKDKYSAELRDK